MSRNDSARAAQHQPVVARRITEDERPESGRVDRVRWNFIYEGDHSLALRLQEQEFSNHFNKNREERWVMRENLKEAKVVQSEEEERIQIEKMLELEQKLELARKDEELARKLQEQEERQNVPARRPDDDRQLRADELLAIRIEEYEKARMKRYRDYRRRQIEQEDLRRAMTAVSLDSANPPNPPETPLPTEEEQHFESDFSDFLTQLPEGLSTDEVKIIQELEDGELSKLLQEAESKRSGARTAAERMRFIRKRAIELRDEQMARVVQQREINRFNERRAKSMVNPEIMSTTSTTASSVNQFDPTSNANNYVTAPVLKPTMAVDGRSQSSTTAYSSVVRAPQNNVAYSPMNGGGVNNLNQPPRRPPPTRPVSSVESSQPRVTSSANPPQRNDSYLEAVGGPNSNSQRASGITDEYLTPNSLLEGTVSHSGSNVYSNGYMAIPEVEATDYELPPEIDLAVEIDHAAIEASRSRRHQQRAASSAVAAQHLPVHDRRSLPPALPMVSPGTPPTADPPQHRLPSGNRGHQSKIQSSNNGQAPVVTNPMYIIERPSKGKNKKDSDCKQQ